MTYEDSLMPSKELLIKSYKRYKFLLAFGNILINLAILSTIWSSYLRFITNTFDLIYALATFIWLAVVGVVIIFLNNRAMIKQHVRKEIIIEYDEIKKELIKAIHGNNDKNGGSQ